MHCIGGRERETHKNITQKKLKKGHFTLGLLLLICSGEQRNEKKRKRRKGRKKKD